jgi:hypothetical protein
MNQFLGRPLPPVNSVCDVVWDTARFVNQEVITVETSRLLRVTDTHLYFGGPQASHAIHRNRIRSIRRTLKETL